jgi:teichuronic acid exporter
MIESGVVVRSVSWALVESMTLIFLSFITLLVTARLLGPADFGVAATVIAVLGLLNTAVEGLFSEALVQRAAIDDGHVDTAVWAAFGIAAGLVLICWLVAGPAAALYGEPRMAPLLRAGSFGLLFSGYGGVQSALIRRAFAFRHLMMRTMVARLTSCGLALLLAFNGYGPWSLIAQYLGATIMGSVALWYWSSRRMPRRPRVVPLRELWDFAGPWLANELVQVNLAKLYQALAAYLFGTYQYGLLGIGFRITETIRDLLVNVANNVGLPVFARVQHDPRNLARHYIAATSTLCVVALPCFAGLTICAPTIVAAILGDAWLPAVPLIQILALGTSVAFTSNLIYTVFSALGRPGTVFPLSVLEMVVSVALLFALSGMGIVAASFAWSLRQVLSALVLQAMCIHVLPLRPVDILRALGRPILLVVIVSISVWMANDVLLVGLPPVARLATLMPTAGLMLILGIALVRPDLIRMVIAQFPDRKKRIGTARGPVIEHAKPREI